MQLRLLSIAYCLLAIGYCLLSIAYCILSIAYWPCSRSSCSFATALLWSSKYPP
jgi:hypothetical protein